MTSTSSTPPPLIAAASTSSPGSTSTGTDSPVIAERSSVERPRRMMPSVAIALAGPDDHDVAELELVGVDVELTAVAANRDAIGHERQQRPQTAPGAGQRVALERLGDREQERERRGLAELAEHHRTDRGDRHQRADAEPPSQQSADRLRDEGQPAGDQRRRDARERVRVEPRDAGGEPDRERHAGQRGQLDLADVTQPLRRLGAVVIVVAAGVAHATASRRREQDVEQSLTGLGERIHDHLAVAPRAHQPSVAQAPRGGTPGSAIARPPRRDRTRTAHRRHAERRRPSIAWDRRGRRRQRRRVRRGSARRALRSCSARGRSRQRRSQ